MYVERPRKALWLKVVLLVAILSAATAVGMANRNAPSTPSLFIMAPVFALAAYALAAFYIMEYRITTDELQVSYPPFLYRISKRDIRSVRVESRPWWMGVGVKFGWHRIGFTTRYGPSILIERKSGFFDNVWLTPDDPEAFAARLKK